MKSYMNSETYSVVKDASPLKKLFVTPDKLP